MTENEHTPTSAIDDMLADLGTEHVGDDRLHALLTDLGSQASDVPVASPDVVALLQGATPLRTRSRQRLMIAGAAGVLAFGGASAAAAANRLPEPLQEVVANVTGAPHPSERPGAKPVKPTDAPNDAPGRLKDSGHDGSGDGSGDASDAKGDNSDAPGQIQKATKPDPSDDGPAKPADPGSHGRARADDARASHEKGDNKKPAVAKDWNKKHWNQGKGWGNKDGWNQVSSDKSKAKNHAAKSDRQRRDNDHQGGNRH